MFEKIKDDVVREIKALSIFVRENKTRTAVLIGIAALLFWM